MPIDSRSYRMADRLAGGNLDQVIEDYSRRGLSLASITSHLFAEHGIEVSSKTLAKWMDELSRGPLPEKEVAS